MPAVLENGTRYYNIVGNTKGISDGALVFVSIVNTYTLPNGQEDFWNHGAYVEVHANENDIGYFELLSPVGSFTFFGPGDFSIYATYGGSVEDWEIGFVHAP